MTPSDMKILVFGDRIWGKGDTLDQALSQCARVNGGYRPTKYVAFICHPDTTVDELGRIVFPVGKDPKEILRKPKGLK